MLSRWSWECQGLEDGTTTQVPALGIEYDELEEALEADERLTPIAVALRTVDGDEVKIRRQGAASVIVTHYPEIPPAIMPVIVTDASAKVNASYVKMRQKGVIEWLKDAPKSYSNMTIRVVPMAASRSTFREKPAQAKELLDMAARYVASVPAGEDILIVGYKGRFYMRGERRQLLDEAIRERLNDADKSRVHWLTYGRHTATNAYRHVKHILLLGLNHMSDALHYAAAGAAEGMDLVKDAPSAEDVRAMRNGMLMDSTLQAILRGHARMGTNGNCGECEVVVVQTKRHGLTKAQWHEMFPGATLVEDRVLLPPVPLSGQLKELAELVNRRLAAGDTEISNQALWETLGMQRTYFQRLVKKPEWQAYIANLGLSPEPLGKGRGVGLRIKRV